MHTNGAGKVQATNTMQPTTPADPIDHAKLPHETGARCQWRAELQAEMSQGQADKAQCHKNRFEPKCGRKTMHNMNTRQTKG